jgi:hypothetical protein
MICFLTPSCTITEEEEETNRGAELLSAPRAIASPRNDDEYFFNYRLANFAPATEPLIGETFGNALTFEERGFWEHASYTSCAVGFKTNLPAISIIEYGETTTYGQTTVQSESYFYQHLHYIRGLESGKTYHYRFLAQDYDGATIASADHTFTAKEFTIDIIRIPDDIKSDPPYVLTEGNARYVLTQDLNVPTLAINIKAHNVELDLDGHTIIYDNVPSNQEGSGIYDEKATFGIRAGLWNFNNFKILNGTVKQGKNGGAGALGQGYNPLFLNHMGGASYNEIAGLTVDYYGDNIGGLYTGNGHVHHNVLYDRGTVIDDRHSAVRALSRSSDYLNANTIVAYNSLRRFRHWGIGGFSGRVEYNELYSDSFDTNSFAIAAGNNLQVTGNKIFGMGYLPIGIGWGSDLAVKGNFIYMRGFAPTMRSEEYARKSAIAGMRITDGEVKNILYEDNTVVLKPEDGCTQARGIWTFNAAGNENIVYRRNTVKVEAMPGNLRNPEDAPTIAGGNPSAYYNGDVNYSLAAVAFSERAENQKEGDPVSGPIIFEDNHLIGNVNLVVIGDGYGICHNVWMYRTKLEKIEHDSEFFRPVRLGFWYWDTWGNRMVDTECVGIAEREILPYFFGGTGKMEIRYGESRTLVLKNRTGAPLANLGITLTTPDDDYAQTLRTDAAGRLSFDLLTARHYQFGNSQADGGVSGVPSHTYYQQYVFSANGYRPLTVSLTQLRSSESITMEGI